MDRYKDESLQEIVKTCDKKPVLEQITIIIPTLDRPILELCFIKIVSGNAWPGGLFVIHQGQSSRVSEWVNLLKDIGINAKYLRNPKLGKSTSINMALKQINTPFFAIIDDDCFVEPDWIEKIVVQLDDHPDWIITGRVEPAGNETVAIVQSMEKSVQYRPRIKFDSMAGGNMGTSISVVQKIGFFDEDPVLRFAAEDAEFAYRALKNGVPIAYDPDVVVFHFGWRGEKENTDRFKAYAYGQGGFYGKYLRQADIRITLRTLYSFTRAARRWIRNSIKGEKEQAILGWSYLTGMFPGIVDGFLGRKKG